MAATTGPEVPMVTQFVSRPIVARPTPSAVNAVTTGTTIANSEPKARNRTSTAATRPYTSLPDGPDSTCTAGPPYSTCAPRSVSGSKAARARSTASGGMSSARSANCTLTMVVRPSGETRPVPGAYGDRTAATAGSAVTCRIAPSTPAGTCGSPTPSPCRTTTCMPSPARSGKLSLSVS